MAQRERRSRKPAPQPSETPDADALVQTIGVYHVDLLAEVEGLLRSITRMQQQVERLRPSLSPPSNSSQRREALKLLAGNLNTFTAKLETLKDTLPEIQAAVSQLDALTSMDDNPPENKA